MLRLEAKPVARYDDTLREVAGRVRAIGREVGAVGLAATQCGVDAQIVVLGDEIYVNPRIVARSPEEDMRVWRERCLALPADVQVELLRDASITVAARDLRGHLFHRQFKDELARAMQHEMDHMNGILIIDHSYDLVTSTLVPSMAAREAPLHAQRRQRAWARPVYSDADVP